jgi:hypothetical protein
MDNRLQNSPPLWRVSNEINDLQRRPKEYRKSFVFWVLPQLGRRIPTVCKVVGVLRRFCAGLATLLFGTVQKTLVGAFAQWASGGFGLAVV